MINSRILRQLTTGKYAGHPLAHKAKAVGWRIPSQLSCAAALKEASPHSFP
jgi:hypothetical protein